MLVVPFIIAGVVVVFMLMGCSLTQIFSSSIQETIPIQIKQGDTCVVESSNGVPRTINECPYDPDDNITINYKQGLPSLESNLQ